MNRTEHSRPIDLIKKLRHRIKQHDLHTRYLFQWQGENICELVGIEHNLPVLGIRCSKQHMKQLLEQEQTLENLIVNHLITFSGPPESFFQLRQIFSSRTGVNVTEQSPMEWTNHRQLNVNEDSAILGRSIATLLNFRDCRREELRSAVNSRVQTMVYESCQASRIYAEYLATSNSSKKVASVLDAPAIGKSMLSEITEELYLSKQAGLIPLSTSGSSGKKFKLYRTSLDYWMGFYRYLLVLEVFGIEGIPPTYFPNPGLKVCETFKMSGLIKMKDAKLPASVHIQNMEEFSSEVLYSFPLFLSQIMEKLEHEKKTLEGIKHIVTVGDFLDQRTRLRCRTIFPNARITTTYGSTETGLMGYECSVSGHYHVFEPDFAVSVLRNDKVFSCGRGKLLITKLNYGGTPFINYDVGDEVELYETECACGDMRTHFQYRGRSKDEVMTTEGKPFNSYEIDHMLAGIEGIQSYSATLRTTNNAADILTVCYVMMKHSTATEVQINKDINEALQTTGFVVNTKLQSTLAPVIGNKRPVFSVMELS